MKGPPAASSLDVSPPSRGALLTALRLWRGGGHGDTLTLDELKGLLLSQRGIGMSEDAAGKVVERCYGAHGETVTCEQLAYLLVPLSECQQFDELSDAEVGPMQVAWNSLVAEQQTSGGSSSGKVVASPPSTIEATADMLRKAAAQVYGLDRMADSRGPENHDFFDVMAARLKAEQRLWIDLPAAFIVFREQQRRAQPKPSSAQVASMLAAFDAEATGTLSLAKFRRFAEAFEASKGEVDAVIKHAMVNSDQRERLSGGWEPRGEDKQKKRPPPRVDIAKACATLQACANDIQIKTAK